MADPGEHEVPNRVGPSDRRFKTRNAPRRRPSAAFVAAIAIFSAAALLLTGGLVAQGGGRNWMPAVDTAAPDVVATPVTDVPTDLKPRGAGAGGLAVCVRLCDGFFFPSATSAGGDEACAAQCPDALTARYTEPAGSDRIEDAVSMRGTLYAALPAANRYQTVLDHACSCHHSAAAGYSESLLNDPTLRKGDVVMTPKGFVVFQGAKTRSITSSDFVALSQARSLPEGLRATLIDIERAGTQQRQAGANSSPSSTASQSQASTPLASSASAK